MAWFPNIPVGLFAVILAVVGAIVSIIEFKGWLRWVMASVFVLLGTVEVLAIVKADRVHDSEVKKLKEDIEQIKTQTKTNRHAHVEFTDPTWVAGDLYLPFRVGKNSDVGILFYNPTDQVIGESFAGYGLEVVPHPLSTSQEREIWNRSEVHTFVGVGGPLNPRSSPHYNTITTSEALTDKQVTGLQRGTMSLCATARVVWADETGKYCTKTFRCLYRERQGTFHPPVFNWHIQGWAYNREDTCLYEHVGDRISIPRLQSDQQ